MGKDFMKNQKILLLNISGLFGILVLSKNKGFIP